ncbi:DUF5677 domain-containing protein [Spirosoma pollinicola]|uniref:Uncharacterized protein n=1 Tax=Spirosoma pollinicola TaxID=2057025 RepID=A0A2K8Z061_9BACT|nr:DUF5677 domain-containing protein [Spirosoma pollinicola]AUD03273.1 hypothetical protein CWM47_16390 [Spirosoma pollinicola]
MIDIDLATQSTIDELAYQKNKNKLSYHAKLIYDYRNLGTYLIDMEKDKLDSHPEISLAVIGIFRRLIELMDACAILIQEGSILPMHPIMRIMLELGFQFEFLLNDPTRIKEKALCIFIAELYDELRQANKRIAIPNIEKLQPITDIQNQINIYQNKIDNVIFDPIRTKYDTATMIKGGPNIGTRKQFSVFWFTISDSINTVTDLRASLNREAMQELIYSEFSKTVHSNSLISDSLHQVDGKVIIKPIRDAHDIEANTNAVIKVASYMYKVMWPRQSYEEQAEYFRARESFIRRYPQFKSAVLLNIVL